MSVSYSLFVKYDSVTDVVTCLEEIIGGSLTKTVVDGTTFYSKIVLGAEIVLIDPVTFEGEVGIDPDRYLGKHFLGDSISEDESILFSDYQYEISVDYTYGTFDKAFYDDFAVMTCLVIANMITKRLKCECIVVEDVQLLLQRFLPENKNNVLL